MRWGGALATKSRAGSPGGEPVPPAVSSRAGQKLAHEVFGIRVVTRAGRGDPLVEGVMQGAALVVVEVVVIVADNGAYGLQAIGGDRIASYGASRSRS